VRKALLAGVPLLLVLAGALVLLRPPGPCPVTRGAYERIEPGMSRTEVEEILGGPPGDYRTRPTRVEEGPGSGFTWEGWWGDEGMVEVCFRGDSVLVTRFQETLPPGPGLLETLRWRLKRRWEKLRGGP
jgi:hypothetical protein